MDTETVLYGVKIGDEDWQEQIITTNPKAIESAKAWAKANGFDRLRVAKIDLSVPPDFRKAVNKL